MTPTPPEPPALATIDLSGGDETPVQAVGRVAIGLLLMLVGGVVALALLAASLFGWMVPAIAEWVDLIGDGLLIGAAIAFALAVVGFEVLRRGKRARAKEAAQASALMTGLDAVGALDGTATPDQIARVVETATGGEPTGDLPNAGPPETRL